MKLLCYVLLVSLVTVSAGLADEILGKITDSETKSVIRDVNVQVIETGMTVSTDKHGVYQIKKIEPGTYHLLFTHVAYDRSDTVQVTVNNSTTFDFELNPSPWVLNDVVVTGTRTPHLLKDVPVQTEVISKRDFERTGATTVDEALTSSIGININEDLSGQGATIRGVEGDRVLVLVDGERAVGRVRGSIDLSQYSLNNVKKIEIVKGTGSTLYGSDAIGGVINIITDKPQGTERTGNAYFEYGRYNQLNPSADFTISNKKTGLMLGAKYYSTDGFDLVDSTLHTNGIENIERWNFSSKLRHKFSKKWSTNISGRFMHEKKIWVESEQKILNIMDTVDVPFDDEEINKRYEGSVSFDYLSGDKYSMNFRVFGTFYDHNWNKYSQTDGSWEDTSDTEDKYFEASYTSNYMIAQDHIATYGFNYNYQDLTSTELIDTKKADQSYAGYLQYEYSPISNLDMILGSRYEHHSSYGGYFNPSFNLMYKPSKSFKLRGFVGKGFRAPSIKEQYFVFDHTSAGYIVYGGYAADPASFAGTDFKDLKQETSINSSVSAEFSYGTIGMHRITYFYNHLDNLIDFKFIDFNEGYWRGRYVYQNIETAITQGIEWESRVRLNKNIDLSISYNYLTTKDLSTGDELRNRPKHTFKFFLTGIMDKYGLGGSLYGDIQSRKIWVPRSNTGGNEEVNQDGEVITEPEYAPSRTRFNVNLFKRFGTDLELSFRVENIFDDTNPTYGYWPEREFFVSMKYTIDF